MSFKVVNAFIHAVIEKLHEKSARRFFLIDSFQMTALWQGSFRGSSKVTIFQHVFIHDCNKLFTDNVYVLSLTQWPMTSLLDLYVTTGTGHLW